MDALKYGHVLTPKCGFPSPTSLPWLCRAQVAPEEGLGWGQSSPQGQAGSRVGDAGRSPGERKGSWTDLPPGALGAMDRSTPTANPSNDISEFPMLIYSGDIQGTQRGSCQLFKAMPHFEGHRLFWKSPQTQARSHQSQQTTSGRLQTALRDILAPR